MSTDQPNQFTSVALIGIGLIGSSLARVLRRNGLVETIRIATRSPENLERARALQLGDFYTHSNAEAAQGADLVVLCVPLRSYSTVLDEIVSVLQPGTVVTDVGSAKRSAIDAIAHRLPPHVHLVPGHPVAGTEHSGPDAGFAELFTGRWTILTPLPGSDERVVDRLTAMWQGVGSDVVRMDADQHDRIMAITSHLPHLIAYTIVGTAIRMEADERSEIIKFSASGFRDFTRIAGSDPIMWRDVFLLNRCAVLEVLSRFNRDLQELEQAIIESDGAKLEQWFTHTRAIRRDVIAAKQA